MRKLPSASYKSRDRGPREFKSRLRKETGDIMELARKKIIKISPSHPIKDASEIMVKEGIRRLPVTSPGNEKLQGVLVTRDIIDFLGGGDKYKIIKNKHSENFLSAINDPVRLIINQDYPYGTSEMSIAETANILIEENVGGVPIIGDDQKVVGIVTESDFVNYLPSKTNISVEERMTRKVVTGRPEISIKDVMKRMISEGFRRLPIIENEEMIGIVTSVDILKYFGSSEVFEHMESGDIEDAISISVQEIMSKKVFTVNPEADLGEAAEIMDQRDYAGLPVVENDKLIGIITERDFLELLV